MKGALALEPDHRLGFTSLEDEIAAGELPVEGALPDWLAGALLRTGPAKFEVGRQRYRHWFDGLAMLHRFSFAGGRVGYRNRFLQSAAYRAAVAEGRIAYSEFATDPCRSLFRRVASMFTPPSFGENANVNIGRFGDDFVALTETPVPVVFDPVTLETLGVGRPAPGHLTVAHPHHDPASGELVSYATEFGPRTTYTVYAQAAGEPQRVIARLRVSQPSYMHSFAITERHVVLVEFPFVVRPALIPLSGRPFIDNYRWRPGRGTLVRLVDLETGALLETYTAEPFFAFHHVNAYELDGQLVVDLCGYEDAEIVRQLSLERLRRRSPELAQPALRRLRLPLAGGPVASEELSDVGLELPRIDDSREGRPYRYVYGVARAGDFYDRIVKVDVDGGPARAWQEPGAYPGEPVFVPAPGRSREDEGVLLSVVLDPGAGTSFLLVLDAEHLTELARARVPHHVPFGFHGQYFADA